MPLRTRQMVRSGAKWKRLDAGSAMVRNTSAIDAVGESHRAAPRGSHDENRRVGILTEQSGNPGAIARGREPRFRIVLRRGAHGGAEYIRHALPAIARRQSARVPCAADRSIRSTF